MPRQWMPPGGGYLLEAEDGRTWMLPGGGYVKEAAAGGVTTDQSLAGAAGASVALSTVKAFGRILAAAAGASASMRRTVAKSLGVIGAVLRGLGTLFVPGATVAAPARASATDGVATRAVVADVVATAATGGAALAIRATIADRVAG